MEIKTQNAENGKKKKLEEAELTVTLFAENDIVVTSGDTSCLAPGTKITMADGSFKNVEDILEGDMVMTLDHESGCFTGREVNHTFKSEDEDFIFILHFAGGEELPLVHMHYHFEQESGKYVCMTMGNAEQYIGKHFYNAEKKSFVELSEVTVKAEKTYYYTIYTKYSIDYIANGMLNVADDAGHLLNLYEFDENLKADGNALAEDIQKYGLFEYNDKTGISREEYDTWNMRYLNIAVGNGLITWDKLWNYHLELVQEKVKAGCICA